MRTTTLQGSAAAMLLLGTLACSLPGCRLPGEARTGARLLAAYTNSVKEEALRFTRSREALAKARQHCINRLELSAVETEQANEQEVMCWTIANPQDPRLGLLNGVLAGTQRAYEMRETVRQLRKEQADSVAAASAAANVRADKLAAVAEMMAQLSKEPDFDSQLKFYIEYFQGVRESIKKAQEAARKQAEQGEKAAEDKAK